MAMAGMRAMRSCSTLSVSRTKLYDSAVRRSSMAPSSSTSRLTCSDSGSARAWEKTASRTGFTSLANSSLSCAATSSAISPMGTTIRPSHPGREPGPRPDAVEEVVVVPVDGDGQRDQKGQEEQEHHPDEDHVAQRHGPQPCLPEPVQ